MRVQQCSALLFWGSGAKRRAKGIGTRRGCTSATEVGVRGRVAGGWPPARRLEVLVREPAAATVTALLRASAFATIAVVAAAIAAAVAALLGAAALAAAAVVITAAATVAVLLWAAVVITCTTTSRSLTEVTDHCPII